MEENVAASNGSVPASEATPAEVPAQPSAAAPAPAPAPVPVPLEPAPAPAPPGPVPAPAPAPTVTGSDPAQPAQPTQPAHQAQQAQQASSDASPQVADAGAGKATAAGFGPSTDSAPNPGASASVTASAPAHVPSPVSGAASDNMAAPKPVPDNSQTDTAPKTSTPDFENNQHQPRQHPQHHRHHSLQQPAQQNPPPEPAAPHFVAPLSYLRPKTLPRVVPMAEPRRPSPLDKEQRQGLKAIRDFLKVRTSYDVLPLSFRLIVLDTDLLIKKTLGILIQNAIVSAPLWDSHTGRFAGLLTSTDYINVIQYHCQFPDEMSKLDQFRLNSLRDIEKAIGAIPIETVSVHPSRPLYEACRRMLSTRARRIPLVDIDDETGQETVVSVITQYRILKFIAVNNEPNTILLKKTIREIKLGTYGNLATAHMGTSVLEAIGLMVRYNISCIPIVDANNKLLNAFEAVDVIPCIKDGAYEELKGTVGEALCFRPEDSPGIYTCTEEDRLDSLFDTIRKSRVHRLIVVDDDNRLKGVISLSDILKYVLIHGEEDAGH
ncbi:hypothetical protein B0I35DRAFT_502660 [Stachybotrys elegans]|uniref:CBS domain-containing protein n=1 Tax=Stachybotrys elegans TaxID=80388 RepID=A0A8K0SS08_9HYPO|nr:hypothetical protein B0I35DRAFT_502660 [Stachybotrys elegans]